MDDEHNKDLINILKDISCTLELISVFIFLLFLSSCAGCVFHH